MEALFIFIGVVLIMATVLCYNLYRKEKQKHSSLMQEFLNYKKAYPSNEKSPDNQGGFTFHEKRDNKDIAEYDRPHPTTENSVDPDLELDN